MFFHQSHNSRSNNNYNAFIYQDTSWAPHFHKNFELLYVLEGEVPLQVNDRTATLRTGECAIILSNQIHSFTVGADTRVWVAVFSEDYVPEFASYIKEKQGMGIAFVPDTEVATLLERRLIFGTDSFMMRRAGLYAVCDQYREKMETEPRRTRNDDLICHVLDYIEQHFREDITLESVAEQFGYEYHYLSRLLNRKYSIRFRSILNDYRIADAVHELETGEKSIADIALSCGFQSIRSFNDVFLTQKGITPAEYRAGKSKDPT